MNTKDFCSDIIDSIDLLYLRQEKIENSYNPVSELITPEWYHSDSIKVTDSNQINWGNLGECDLIQAIADSLEKAKNPSSVVGIEFERSFCSWYQSYHYRPREKWGIHMRYDSLIRITSLLYHNCPAIARKLDAAKSAFLYLFIHELFHHILENAVSIIEIISGESHLYTKYYTDVYSQVFNSSYCIEEALGNSYLFQWARKCHINRDFLKKELLKQGPGYSDFIHYIGTNFIEGNRILLSQVRQGRLNPTVCDPLEQIVSIPDPIQYSSFHNVPIWLHRKAHRVH